MKDSYDSFTETWYENGVILPGANVTIYDSSNSKILYTGQTDKSGSISFSNLGTGTYNVKISYSTYEPYTQKVTLSNSPVTINHIFYPDILFFVSYTDHKEKIDTLMNLSRRICYVSTTNYDNTKEWLFEHANFIQLDMYADSSTYTFNIDVVKESPAYENYMIAYTFGSYSDALINKLNLHFVGSSSANNTYNTLENTYIGSYFQAEDIPEVSVLKTNMINLLAYIEYLINPTQYSNPTLDPTKTPLLASEAGIYHPDFGTITICPNQKTINSWILANPGYNNDGIGSLNWMTTQYAEWKKANFNPTAMVKEFEAWYKQNKNYDKSFIIVVSYYAGGDVVDSLIRTYESQGRPSFNLYQSGTSPAMSSLLLEVSQASTIGISSVNSLYSWSLDYAKNNATNNLSELDSTILKAVYDISKSGYESDLGPQMEWTYAVTIPSFEGVFGAVVVSYLDEKGNTHVIQSGIEKLAKMTLGWANLKDKNNSDKKISIVLYNYPPGKAEIGASYLDVFQSTYDLLYNLYLQGYDVGMTSDNFIALSELTDLIVECGNKGTWAQGLLNQYVEKYFDSLMANGQLISLDQFYNLTSGINSNLMKELVDYWGDGLGNIMVYNNTYIVIPGIQFGNVLVTFQPSRGWEEVANYHDTTLPPHQQYVAFYEWLDKTYQTDAIIYMGTHGTLEFLPGHQIGVQEGDWTFELNLNPSIYLYIVSNPGEAMVARDRLGALMITHMTPAIVSSSLYGNYTLLSQAIDGYKNAVKLNVTQNAESYKEQIIELAAILGFGAQKDGESFDDWIAELHNYLDELENDFNALGLHTIGKVLTGEELIEETVTIVSSQTNIYNNIIAYLYPSLSNLNYYDDIRGNDKYILEAANAKYTFYIIVELIANGTSPDTVAKRLNYSTNSELYNNTLYIAEVIANIRANNEWNALFTVLNGGYLKSGLFADPAYGNSIPTGYNGYATDTTKIPSKASYDSAVRIIDILLVDYYEEHGEWPELLALILWGTEILRTDGIGISEFLYLLGCKPIWSETGTVIGVQILPLEDLKVTLSNGSIVNRPRIDVYASMVTSNADWIKWMVTATYLANGMNESTTDNYVKKHYAENPTLDRLFGLPGNVLEGTGMSTLIPNTADWDIETVNKELADIYMNRVSYAWTLDENGKVVINQNKETFKYLLSNTDLITQNFDSTWRLFDSDDYYDWFGGLYNAALQFGANPDTAFVDIRNKNIYQVRTYIEEINFEIRSVITNPKYLDAYGKTTAGMNGWATSVQNLYGNLVISGSKLDSSMGDMLADSVMYMSSNVNNVGSAAAWQSNAAWMMYMYNQGLADISSSKIEQLANQMIEYAVQYGVACCHHTCKNINFNNWVLQVSTLSAEKKQQYKEVFYQATLNTIDYDTDTKDDSNSENNQNSGESSSNTQDAANEVLANGTSSKSGQGSAGATVGTTGSEPITGSSSSSAASTDSSSSSSSESGEDAGSSYEISKSSTSKSAPSAESSMPAFFIIAVIALILIFSAGYGKHKKED